MTRAGRHGGRSGRFAAGAGRHRPTAGPGPRGARRGRPGAPTRRNGSRRGRAGARAGRWDARLGSRPAARARRCATRRRRTGAGARRCRGRRVRAGRYRARRGRTGALLARLAARCRRCVGEAGRGLGRGRGGGVPGGRGSQAREVGPEGLPDGCRVGLVGCVVAPGRGGTGAVTGRRRRGRALGTRTVVRRRRTPVRRLGRHRGPVRWRATDRRRRRPPARRSARRRGPVRTELLTARRPSSPLARLVAVRLGRRRRLGRAWRNGGAARFRAHAPPVSSGPGRLLVRGPLSPTSVPARIEAVRARIPARTDRHPGAGVRPGAERSSVRARHSTGCSWANGNQSATPGHLPGTSPYPAVILSGRLRS